MGKSQVGGLAAKKLILPLNFRPQGTKIALGYGRNQDMMEGRLRCFDDC